jgi:anhydro-N-acetylmuramic acid kinase
MNQLALQSGYEFDRDGMLADSGNVSRQLLGSLNSLPYYQLAFPKSLGKEWVVQHIFPLLKSSGLPANNQLATFCEHIAVQIASATRHVKESKMLITGGGAFNKFLTGRIRHHASPEIIIPDAYTVNFKEALIFAFLGVLRWRNEINCLTSVTGASKDSSGGAIY